MVRAKRKREGGAGEAAAAAAREARINDPYRLGMRPCRPADHQRKKSGKTAGPGALRNCADNPNCLYGLGEHQKGIWQGRKMIQRVFGDDPRERRRAAATSGADLLPCGLRNLGATCYLNSMLQCLFVNLPFRRAVYEWAPKEKGVSEQQARQMRALQKLFAQMQLGNQSMYDPTEFASTLALNNVVQQDAQEFNKLLLTHLRTIFCQSRVTTHWNLVDRIFQGHMNYVTKCLRCNTRSLRPSSYYEISLNIKGHKTLEDSIASYLSPEVLEGENKYFCDHCDSKECAERYLELDPKRLPDTITFQLMRFVYDANAGRKKKLMDVIEINETLNMTEMLRRSGNAEAFTDGDDAVYRLSGYLNHRGKSAHVGHYTASVAHPETETGSSSAVSWYEFDDTVVSSMTSTISSTAREVQGKKIRSRDIYMLLYVRDSSSATQRANTQGAILPSPECLEDVEALNTAFDADVEEYRSKVQGMEKRIAERMDAYKRFFEKEHPYADPSATSFYWVDVQWLRNWVSGEESLVGDSTKPTSESQPKESSSPEDGDVTAAQETSSPMMVEVNGGEQEDGANTDEGDSPDGAIVIDDDDNSASGDQVPIAVSPLREQDIPFSSPTAISPFCCIHSRPPPALNGLSPGDGPRRTRRRRSDASETAAPPARFSPEMAPKLKRISAKLYDYLKKTCNLKPSEASDPDIRVESRTPFAFEAATYRCVRCEQEFRGKLSDDAEQLKEVELELGLLKAGTANISGGFFMSRAWMSSYKIHLQGVHKRLLAIAKKEKKNGPVQQEINMHCVTEGDSHEAADMEPVWLAPLNADITCVHGNLTLEKRKYRAMPAEAWMYFTSKFTPTHVFPAPSTEPCPECQVNEAATEETIQIERACRDHVLERHALSRLYRKKGSSALNDADSGTFLLSEVFSLSGTHGFNASKLSLSSSWRMFIVPRGWMREWREYIRDVDHAMPPPLSSGTLLCQHGLLILPQNLVTALDGGAPIDRNDVNVEFVTQEEMVDLVDLYGDPTAVFFYALLDRGNGRVHWRRCPYASVLVSGQVEAFGGDCPDDVIPLDCMDDNDTSVRCSECEDVAQQVHRCELENFENRIVNVQLLLSDQPVPSGESLTAEANVSGRRRSKRIRPGSASTWLIAANATDTVYMFKAKIYAEIDALPVRQRLYFKGELLQDHRTLKECGVKASDAVFMRLSEDNADDLAIFEGNEPEVGFQDSVFLSHVGSTASTNGNSGEHAANNGAHRPHDFAASASATLVWVCPACTFVNDDTELECEMCTTPKVMEV